MPTKGMEETHDPIGSDFQAVGALVDLIIETIEHLGKDNDAS